MDSFIARVNCCKRDDIKFFRIANHESVLLVTKDDRVYALGRNYSGQLGLGHFGDAKTSQPIEALHRKSIQNFYFGDGFVLALSSDNKLYSWGKNNLKQLARCTPSELSRTIPTQVEFFQQQESKISQVITYNNSSMVILDNGKVYFWGLNTMSLLLPKGVKDIVQVQSLSHINVKHIINRHDHKKQRQLFIIDKKDNVYSLGDNTNCCLGQADPGVISVPSLIGNIKSVKDIKCLEAETYFLSHHGELSVCGQLLYDTFYYKPYWKSREVVLVEKFRYEIPVEIKLKQSVKKIEVIDDTVMALSDDNVVYELYGTKTIETVLKNFTDHPNYETSIMRFKLSGKYKKHFKFKISKDGVKGCGAFGKVFQSKCKGIMKKGKGKSKVKKRDFALKKMWTKKLPKDLLDESNEWQIMKNLNNDFVVQLYDYWVDRDFLYIRMELCDETLKDIINDKKRLPLIQDYVISCELLRQLLEAINYLHSKNIIHRDLKPSNVLAKTKDRKAFPKLKLSDFGLSKLVANQSSVAGASVGSVDTHSNLLGTFNYSAPELSCDRYNEKVDVFSLGVIMGELFPDHGLAQLQETGILPLNVHDKLPLIGNMKTSMLEHNHKLRPSCSSMLDQIKQWSLTYRQIKANPILSDPNVQVCNFSRILYFLKRPPIFNQLKLFTQLDHHVVAQIKYFKVFNNLWNKNKSILYVTKSDTVHFYCDFNLAHTEIVELNHNLITQFYVGSDFIVARSNEDRLFSWGKNNKGQLGRGFTRGEKFIRPGIVEFPDYNGQKIKQICVGHESTMVLFENSEIFVWGSNEEGYLGDIGTTSLNKPTKLELPGKFKIEKVYCHLNSYFLITSDGEVYSWGDNNHYSLGHNELEKIISPKLVNNLSSTRIIDLVGLKNKTYFLSENGDVYFCGFYFDKFELKGKIISKPTKIEHAEKFIEVKIINKCSKHMHSMFMSENGNVFQVNQVHLIKTNCQSIDECCVKHFQSTLGTYEITD